MSVYEHFRKEEHSFIDQVIEWKSIVTEQYRPKLTDFLDPRQQEICKLIIGNNEDIGIGFHGGSTKAERKRCLLYPPYLEPDKSDYELAYYELDYPKKFARLEHRQILGALMNVGLRREKFGDIVTDGERFQIILAEEVADFVSWNLTSVGKTKVELKNIEAYDIILIDNVYEEMQVTVSSLRLDTVLSEIYRLSRAKVKPIIEAGEVKVNWQVIEDGSYLLMEEDVLSMRGKGRSKLLEIEGKTKKDKYRLRIGFPKH